jgi:sporulation integral membrane protein YtvI
MIFCIFAGVAAAYIIFKYLLALLLPLIIGACIGSLASALALKLSKYTRAGRRLLAFSVLISLLFSFGSVLYFSVKRLITELRKLTEGFAEGGGAIADFFGKASALISSLSEKLASGIPGESGSTAEKITEYAEGLLGEALSTVGAAIPGILTSILSALPDLLLGAVVAVIVAFYFTLDSAQIKKGIMNILPSRAERMLSHIKKEAAVAAIGYLRSYSLILLITFAEIFFGLTVLGVEYSFLIAAISAAIDILPILGVGIILIPWAIINLMTRKLFLGIGLIILYVITVVIRQFIEPKLVGESLGLHPLLTLAAFYLGYRLFDFSGIFIAPVILVLWRAVKAYSSGHSTRSSA